MPEEQTNLFDGPASAQTIRLRVILDADLKFVHLRWTDARTDRERTSVLVSYEATGVRWLIAQDGQSVARSSMAHPSSIRAELNRLRKQFPVADSDITAEVRTSSTQEPNSEAPTTPVQLPESDAPWLWIEREIATMARAQAQMFRARLGLRARPDAREQGPGARKPVGQGPAPPPTKTPGKKLIITLNYAKGGISLVWFEPAVPEPVARLNIRCTGVNELTWDLKEGQRQNIRTSTLHGNSIGAQLFHLQERLPVAAEDISATAVKPDPTHPNRVVAVELRKWGDESPWGWLAAQIAFMGEDLQEQFNPTPPLGDIDPQLASLLEKAARKAEKERQNRQELQARILANQQRQRQLKEQRDSERRARAASQALAAVQAAQNIKPSLALPQVPVSVDLPQLELQDTLLPLSDLRPYFLRERAALWWVTNQSDDLLSLPYCNIQRLEYQIRSALRIIGPLRGRALLSDEVGLGKTIEAGLVLKEYLTRGMVKRFLVVTVPSLVDQWEEELGEKFHLSTATTNQSQARNDPERFWRENSAIIASLHTLKQPAHLAVAQTVNWDMLIIDEAHYLRNRTSQAWQAVNALPRQFLLLLTATPVQNSLEELYNLVTLLQPGQLPSPKEFRARFVDPKRPHQPREPEELRRLLGQVMIRNTRANAGINLPARRAETVLFEPDASEQAFWKQWEEEFRQSLTTLNASQASLWGRLLLQTAGSSAQAWREALKSFPDRSAARRWSDQAPLDSSWKKKCQLLEPLTKGEGGLVIFTQFLQTQAAIADELRQANVSTFVVNGQTPAAERQPITESFRQTGGALLLTHSGTEGRNLQFCHRLVNFDLPWNPMEIEQRIGRLHRLGQQHPVRIYNLVQAGTLQEHLLEILQEKLNLFELVVGETGLILGERFTSDEFAEEILRRWRDSEGSVAQAMESLGDELAAARQSYGQIKQLDETLFAKDYESL